jgi:GNAT superfamily N-acetyltransferase
LTTRYEWRGTFDNAEVIALQAEAFDYTAGSDDVDVRERLDRHSLGWVCARDARRLVGFVNVAWDGAVHAFLLDTMVARDARRHGIGRELVRLAIVGARDAGCAWLHVDFEPHLRTFYLEACGFRPTEAGLIDLKQ